MQRGDRLDRPRQDHDEIMTEKKTKSAKEGADQEKPKRAKEGAGKENAGKESAEQGKAKRANEGAGKDDAGKEGADQGKTKRDKEGADQDRGRPVPPRLQEKFHDQVLPKLRTQLGRANLHSLPRLEKIVLNMGVGTAISEKKHMEEAVS